MKISMRIVVVAVIVSMNGFSFGEDTGSTTPTNTSSKMYSTTDIPQHAARTSENKRVDFLMDVSEAYEKQNEIDLAIEAYERILEIEPDNLAARFSLGRIFIMENRAKEAEALLLKMKEELPDNPFVLNNLAWMYATAKDTDIRNGEKALTYAQEALMIAPGSYEVWSTLSEAHYINGNYEEALRAINYMTFYLVAKQEDRMLSEEEIKAYNNQILKCRRAVEASKTLEEVSTKKKD